MPSHRLGMTQIRVEVEEVEEVAQILYVLLLNLNALNVYCGLCNERIRTSAVTVDVLNTATVVNKLVE